jgi:hypothetical protein
MVPGITGYALDLLVTFGKELLLPFLTFGFFSAVILRTLIYWTVKREQWFVMEFERRLQRYMNYENPHGQYSFTVTLKRILEKTFYEVFQNRSAMRRRKLDHVMEPSDRLFLIQQGAAYLVRDSVKYASTLRKDNEKEEKDELIEVSKHALSLNPCFTKLFGLFPIGPVNDFLNQLPGLFIVGGIFGTFLGIMKALPELQGMNPSDAEGTKLIMDAFLVKIAFSMSTSTMGILYSVAFTVFNSFINPEKLFMAIVNRFERNLHQLWRKSHNNDLADLGRFDEHRDPLEALAELALQKEISADENKRLKKENQDRRGWAVVNNKSPAHPVSNIPAPPKKTDDDSGDRNAA